MPFIIIGLGLLCLSFFLLYVLRRRSEPLGRPGSFGNGLGETEARLDRILRDIQDVSRNHITKLDTKIRMLEQLLSEADRRKEEIRELIASSRGIDASPPPDPAEEAPAVRPANPLHDQVYALQDKGRALDDICGETGLEKGEVELIMGLRRMGAS